MARETRREADDFIGVSVRLRGIYRFPLVVYADCSFSAYARTRTWGIKIGTFEARPYNILQAKVQVFTYSTYHIHARPIDFYRKFTAHKA